MAVTYKAGYIESTNVRFYFGLKQKALQILFSLTWAVSQRFTRWILKRLFFSPVSYSLSNDQKDLLEKAETFTFVSGGHELKGYKWGQGPGILFIHGWAGHGLQCCNFLTRLLDEGFSVWTFDHAGHGASQGNTANYFRFSDAVYDFVNSRDDIELHTAIAHSLGASAWINYLWRTRQKISTILIAPALHLAEMLETTFSGYGIPKKAFRQLIQRIELETGHEFEQENPIDLIKDLTHEILIIHDKKDKAVPFEDSWNASLVQNNIQLLPTSGMGHIRILFEGSLINQIVEKIRNFGNRASSHSLMVADNDTGDDNTCCKELDCV